MAILESCQDVRLQFPARVPGVSVDSMQLRAKVKVHVCRKGGCSCATEVSVLARLPEFIPIFSPRKLLPIPGRAMHSWLPYVAMPEVRVEPTR